MKLVVILLCLSIGCYGQAELVVDTVKVKLKPWQKEQVEKLQEQSRMINEQLQFLVDGLLRENKVVDSLVVNISYKPGELILITRRKKHGK